MRKYLRIIVLFVVALSASACFRMQIERPVSPEATIEYRQHFFMLGFVGESEIDLAVECPQGISSFGDGFSPLDVLLGVVSVGIYTPKTVKIACEA